VIGLGIHQMLVLQTAVSLRQFGSATVPPGFGQGSFKISEPKNGLPDNRCAGS
jgi:hypothetical protein